MFRHLLHRASMLTCGKGLLIVRSERRKPPCDACVLLSIASDEAEKHQYGPVGLIRMRMRFICDMPRESLPHLEDCMSSRALDTQIRAFSIMKKQNVALLIVGDEFQSERLQNLLKNLATKNINVGNLLWKSRMSMK